MKKSIVILGAIAVVLLMVSTSTAVPQTQSMPTMEKTENCSICPIKTSDGRPFCEWLESEMVHHFKAAIDAYPYETVKEFLIYKFHGYMYTLLEIVHGALLCR